MRKIRLAGALALISFTVTVGGTALAAPDEEAPTTEPPKRLKNLCGISLVCAPDKSHGFLLIPSAGLGLVQIPFSETPEGEPSYRDGFGSFKPSIGITGRYWFLKGWLDGHAQLLYGTASNANGTTNDSDYVWGGSVGIGGLFSIVNVDLGVFNRRRRLDSGDVDTGGAVLINFDITSAGVLLGTAISQ